MEYQKTFLIWLFIWEFSMAIYGTDTLTKIKFLLATIRITEQLKELTLISLQTLKDLQLTLKKYNLRLSNFPIFKLLWEGQKARK